MSPEEDPTQRADRTRGGTNDTHHRAQVYLRQLAERLDPPSFDLLLKILSGVNTAFARHDQTVDLTMTEEERTLYTPELRAALGHLLELAGFNRPMMLAGLEGGSASEGSQQRDAPPAPRAPESPPHDGGRGTPWGNGERGQPPAQARMLAVPMPGAAGVPLPYRPERFGGLGVGSPRPSPPGWYPPVPVWQS